MTPVSRMDWTTPETLGTMNGPTMARYLIAIGISVEAIGPESSIL